LFVKVIRAVTPLRRRRGDRIMQRLGQRLGRRRRPAVAGRDRDRGPRCDDGDHRDAQQQQTAGRYAAQIGHELSVPLQKVTVSVGGTLNSPDSSRRPTAG
jgi:hypothetical protein